MHIPIILLCSFVLSNDFQSVKTTTKGIFGWFNALSPMKKPFNNKTIFGFRVNTSEPDLKMIARDITDYLDLYDLNISGQIADSVSEYDPNNLIEDSKILADDYGCESPYQNIYQLCYLTGIYIDLSYYGIPSEHVDILIANFLGYFPCGLLIVVLGCVTIIFYIIQFFLSCFVCKANDHTKPSPFSIVIFYAAIAVLIISALFFFLAYIGVRSMYHTLSNLDTVVPQITSSLASFLTDLSNYGIPNTFGLLVESVLNVSDSIFEYVNKTADSFILPTILWQDKMVSDDENDMGVFSIYNRRIQPAANRFYERARMYPKLKDISKYFARQDWTEYTEEMQDLLDEEKDLVSNMTFLNTFFDYLNVTIFPFKEFTENLTNNVVEGTNKTVGELINDLQEKNLSSFQYLDDVYQNVDYYEPAYRWTLVGFLIYGIVLIGAIIFLSIMFWMHSRCSICVASTISIYPLIATLLMFVFAFIFTGIGYADVSISNQFEDALDEFLMDVINVTIPQREIVFPQINITFYTQETYVGVLNISSIVFPEQMNNLKKIFLIK